jgi:L-Ala-D/L-Glu epimerase
MKDRETMIDTRIAGAHRDVWPLAETFTVSRRSVDAVETLTIELVAGDHSGRGEASGLYYSGETIASMEAAIRAVVDELAGRLSRQTVRENMPAAGARCALDSALWDIEAKTSGRRAWEIAGIQQPLPIHTAVTISLADPERMAASAARLAGYPLVKVKVGRDGLVADLDRLAAVRGAVGPEARFVVDPNTGWTPDDLGRSYPSLIELGVSVIEQPCPPAMDGDLPAPPDAIALCADESVTDTASLADLSPRFNMINIKLEKCGGLTEALALDRAARARGLRIMVGCMNGSSLAMAPALLLARNADVVDLDGPIGFIRDREPGLRYERSLVYPPDASLWG